LFRAERDRREVLARAERIWMSRGFGGATDGSRDRAASFIRRSGWLILLVLGVVGTAAVMATSGDARRGVYAAIGSASALAVLGALYLHRPRSVLPWVALGVTQVVWVVGDQLILTAETFPSVADAMYNLAYLLLVTSITLFVRTRSPRAEGTSLVDAAIVSVAVAVPGSCS